MKKTAIAFLTKDRVELSEKSIRQLLAGMYDKFDLWCIDGSVTPAGNQFILDFGPEKNCYFNVRGGAGAAIVFALTKMLEAGYDYCGLVALFKRNAIAGRSVAPEQIKLIGLTKRRQRLS